MGKVIKVKVLFFLLYLLWFTNGTGGYYTWNLDDQALSPPPTKIILLKMCQFFSTFDGFLSWYLWPILVKLDFWFIMKKLQKSENKDF